MLINLGGKEKEPSANKKKGKAAQLATLEVSEQLQRTEA